MFGTGLLAAGVGVFAVRCCVGLPLIAGLLGSVALGGVLGVGAGVLAVIVVSALIVVRVRRRRSCAPPGVTAQLGGRA